MSNVQIEMISVCGVDGSLTPLRFRLEDEEHQLCTVAIRQVEVDCKKYQNMLNGLWKSVGCGEL